MKKLFFLALALFLLGGCGESIYSDSSSLSSVNVFQTPKADCGGNPCL